MKKAPSVDGAAFPAVLRRDHKAMEQVLLQAILLISLRKVLKFAASLRNPRKLDKLDLPKGRFYFFGRYSQ